VATVFRSVKEQQISVYESQRNHHEACGSRRPGYPDPRSRGRMRSLDVGGLRVFKEDRLVGMLTDRDLTLRAITEGKDPMTTTVQQVMTADVAYCFEDQEVEEAGRNMKGNQIRRLPVLNHDFGRKHAVRRASQSASCYCLPLFEAGHLK
jgi:CBS domain-containing protein